MRRKIVDAVRRLERTTTLTSACQFDLAVPRSFLMQNRVFQQLAFVADHHADAAILGIDV